MLRFVKKYNIVVIIVSIDILISEYGIIYTNINLSVYPHVL